MKQLFRKDVRENFRIALLGLAIFTIVIIVNFRSSGDLLHEILLRQMSGSISPLQPLLSDVFLGAAMLYCAIFGAALGWFQARSEAHRDLWAFLVHRPITRSEIFRGKAAAGLLLYFIGAGLPLIVMTGFAAMPGVVAVPFDPAMALPAVAIFLTGIAYYFAGMLTALRQARWFGSRTFGVGAAIAASVAVRVVSEFWMAAGLAGLLIVCTAVAAWGAYESGGFYRGQPRSGKFALAISLTCGSSLVLALLTGLLALLFHQESDYTWQHYAINHDGQIFVVTSREGVESYADLNGKPLLDDAGQPMKTSEFNKKERVPSGTAYAGDERPFPRKNSYDSTSRFFVLWSLADKNLWYLDRHGKLTGFSGLSRKHVGDIVPRNAAGEESFIGGDLWTGYSYFNSYNLPSILCSASMVYRVDLDERKLQSIFTADPTDPIVGFVHSSWLRHILVLSSNNVRILNMDGETRVSLPYTPAASTYPMIEASYLGTSNTFAIWFHPNFSLNAESNWKMPIHIAWVSGDNRVLQTRDLPALHTSNGESLMDKITTAFIPPAFQVFALFDRDHSLKAANLICFIPSLICVAIGWTLLRRYRFTAGAAVAWMCFIIFLGIPAFLAFLSAQEWPKRETCPNCGKPRAVDHEHCEHCAAGFPPPDKIGIEIFEPLASP